MSKMFGEKAICLLSGGQDSTTSLYWARENFDEVFALTIHYGQRHSREIVAAEKITGLADVGHKIIDTDLLKKFVHSALLDSSDVGGVHPRNPKLPASFVPGRNIIFFTIASIFAYQMNYNNIVAGICQTDYSGYPDCRGEFKDSIETSLRLGLDLPELKIHTPLLNLSKKESVDLASGLSGCFDALAYSHTCYEGIYPPCTVCPSCLIREKGFAEAGFEDPLYTRAKKDFPHLWRGI